MTMAETNHKLGLTAAEAKLLRRAHELTKRLIARRPAAPSREQDVSIDKLCDVRNGLAHVIITETGVAA